MNITLTIDRLCRGKRQLQSDNLISALREQLASSGACRTDRTYRFVVRLRIIEGARRPANALDNYYKKIVDTIGYTGFLWSKDEQIDEMHVTRQRDVRQETTTVSIEIMRIGESRDAA